MSGVVPWSTLYLTASMAHWSYCWPAVCFGFGVGGGCGDRHSGDKDGSNCERTPLRRGSDAVVDGVMALSFAELRVRPTAAPSCVASVNLLPESSSLLVCRRRLLIRSLHISCQIAVRKDASDRNPNWPTRLGVLDVARQEANAIRTIQVATLRPPRGPASRPLREPRTNS
jgi:hypothetical protein